MRHTVSAPPLYFCADIETGTIRAYDNPRFEGDVIARALWINYGNGGSIAIPTPSTESNNCDIVQEAHDGMRPNPMGLYERCVECNYYSMLFGGSPQGGVGDRRIKNEEEFEVAKGEFVKHFNEKHKDIMRNREHIPKTNKKFKKLESRGITFIGDSVITFGTVRVEPRQAFGTSMFFSAVRNRDTINNTGAMIPEYETISPIQTSLQSLRARNGRGAGRMRD